MRIAIVHDSLIEFGGAERVLQALCNLYPTAHLYTSVCDKHFIKTFFPKSSVKHIPIPQRFFARHPSLFQALSPLLWRLLNFNEYDVVISISGHLMSNLVNPGDAYFVQYLLCAPKNIYHFESATNLQKIIPYDAYMKYMFRRALGRAHYHITLSLHMQGVFAKTFAIASDVIYPPMNVLSVVPKRKHKDYYLIVSRLDRSKSIELAIQACNRLKEKLVIVGVTNEPRYEKYLRQIAGSTITFMGFQTDMQINYHYAHAKAFLFTPKNEDFGIAPVEAMAHGVPVIAYRGGGAMETIVDGKTGIFFRDHTVESLVEVMNHFDNNIFNEATLERYARRFSLGIFQKKMRHYIARVMS